MRFPCKTCKDKGWCKNKSLDSYCVDLDVWKEKHGEIPKYWNNVDVNNTFQKEKKNK
jgi:predicted SnoaL-like aldol condensation-catalyzing enzyme